jgi:hypothetical protein
LRSKLFRINSLASFVRSWYFSLPPLQPCTHSLSAKFTAHSKFCSEFPATAVVFPPTLFAPGFSSTFSIGWCSLLIPNLTAFGPFVTQQRLTENSFRTPQRFLQWSSKTEHQVRGCLSDWQTAHSESLNLLLLFLSEPSNTIRVVHLCFARILSAFGLPLRVSRLALTRCLRWLHWTQSLGTLLIVGYPLKLFAPYQFLLQRCHGL